MRERRHLRLLAGALGLLVAPSACIQKDGTRYNPIATVVGEVSVEGERATGLAVDNMIQRQLPMIRDPSVLEFVNDLGLQIVRGIEPQPFVYRFRVVDNPTLNAFATSGGYIYLHTGLILTASNVDELAGVVGHEIAHIHRRHYARMRKRSQLPDLAVSVLAIAAAIATGEPGLFYGLNAANVALKLSYSREMEAEADESGGVYVARAGLDPEGSTGFFERLLEERPGGADSVPPYLFSHPELEERIQARKQAGETLHAIGDRDPQWDRRFWDVRARLNWLIDNDRNQMLLEPGWYTATERSEGDEETQQLRQVQDPRVAYAMGEEFLELGDPHAAVTAFRRTVELDPRRAAVFYRLGLAYKAAGDRSRAVHALEEAARLAKRKVGVGARAAWELAKLDFGVVAESGFAEGSGSGETPGGAPRESFAEDTTRIAWWCRVAPRFVDYTDTFVIRWRAPNGVVQQEGSGERSGRVYLESQFDAATPLAPGPWTVEVLLDGDVVGRSTTRVEAPTSGPTR